MLKSRRKLLLLQSLLFRLLFSREDISSKVQLTGDLVKNQALMFEQQRSINRKLQFIMEENSTNYQNLCSLISHFTVNTCQKEEFPVFPIETEQQLKEVNAEVMENMKKYVDIILGIIKPNGLVQNFNRLLGMKIILQYNYDGMAGKGSFKEFQALNMAFYEANKREGYTEREYIKDIRDAFKKLKCRYFKNCYDTRKKLERGGSVTNNTNKSSENRIKHLHKINQLQKVNQLNKATE